MCKEIEFRDKGTEFIELNEKQKFEDEKLKDYSFEVVFDEDAPNPRDNKFFEGNLSKMICFHPKYNLGDTHEFEDAREFLLDLVAKYGDETKACIKKWKSSLFTKELGDTIMKRLEESGKIVISYLTIYDHSGICLSRGERHYTDDYSLVGFVYQTKEDTLKAYPGIKETEWKAKANENIDEELKIYNCYLAGDTYRFRLIFNPTGDILEEEGGYYGRESFPDAYETMKAFALS